MSTIMRRISSVAILSLFLFACQKDLNDLGQGNPEISQATVTVPADAGAGYYIRFKSGQEEASYNYNAKAILADAGTAKSLVLQGSANPDDGSKESIRLYMSFLSGSPAVGTYKQGDPSFKYLLSGSVTPDADYIYSAGLTPSTELPLTITISSISDGVMKGTFKGAFYKHDLTTGVLSSKEYINYSEGAFSLPVY